MVMEIIVSVVLLFVGIAVLVIIHICIVGRAFRRGFGNEGVLQMGGIPIVKGTGMNSQDLKKLPSFEYNEGDSNIDCVVCLDNFKVGDKCRVLPNCHHWFHAHCVDTWLGKTPSCPLCRTTAKPAPKVHGVDTGERSRVPPMVVDDSL